MARGTPQITVLMPCRNPHPGFLKEALLSVCAQTDPRWRMLIIVDAGDEASRRAVLDALDSFGDPRMSLLTSQSRWTTGALNTGMRQAASAWVCALHCDDRIEPTAIEVLTRERARHPEADFLHSARRYIDDRGRLLGERPVRREFTPADFVHSFPVQHIQCWKAEKALAIGGMDESLGPHGADDYDFAWSMAEAGCRFHAVPEFLYVYRDHREHFRLTTHVPLEVQVAELRKIFRKHGVPEATIEAELARRTDGYLQQALFHDEPDRQRKLAGDFDPHSGWRERY